MSPDEDGPSWSTRDWPASCRKHGRGGRGAYHGAQGAACWWCYTRPRPETPPGPLGSGPGLRRQSVMSVRASSSKNKSSPRLARPPASSQQLSRYPHQVPASTPSTPGGTRTGLYRPSSELPVTRTEGWRAKPCMLWREGSVTPQTPGGTIPLPVTSLQHL